MLGFLVGFYYQKKKVASSMIKGKVFFMVGFGGIENCK
jgi:hypothetical protein